MGVGVGEGDGLFQFSTWPSSVYDAGGGDRERVARAAECDGRAIGQVNRFRCRHPI